MIGFGARVRVFARTRPTDLRLGFAGLAGLVQGELGRDLLAGDWFLFVSKRRHSARVLCWDGSGLCLYSKRLAKGQFAAIWERARGWRGPADDGGARAVPGGLRRAFGPDRTAEESSQTRVTRGRGSDKGSV